MVQQVMYFVCGYPIPMCRELIGCEKFGFFAEESSYFSDTSYIKGIADGWLLRTCFDVMFVVLSGVIRCDRRVSQDVSTLLLTTFNRQLG